MTLNKLLNQLKELADKGYGEDEVRLLCCDDNPLDGEGIRIKGTYAISHYNEDIDGVYIDGTVD